MLMMWCGHFSAAHKEKATERPEKVAQVVISRRFKHHAVCIGCQHQRCQHYCPRQGTGAMLNLGKAPYC